MVSTRRIALLGSLMLITLTVIGCTREEENELVEQPPAEDAQAEVDQAVKEWVQGNVDELAEEIGRLVALDVPILRDIAADLVAKGLMAWVEVTVLDIGTEDGSGRYSARVRLELPLEAQLPVVGKRGYRVSVEYDLLIDNGKVIDDDIDTFSVRVEATGS